LQHRDRRYGKSIPHSVQPLTRLKSARFAHFASTERVFPAHG
jgi:hypothetical protein